jgi:arginine exporter protein ArgO
MGVFLLCTPPKVKEVNRPLHERNLLIAYLSTCFLTLWNPITILSMTLLIVPTGMGGRDTNYARAALLVAGIFAASTVWWIFICTCSHWLARKLGNGFVRMLNLIAAIFVITLGVWLVVHQARKKLHEYNHHVPPAVQPGPDAIQPVAAP